MMNENAASDPSGTASTTMPPTSRRKVDVGGLFVTLLSAALIAGSLICGWRLMNRMALNSPVLPLDSYYYRDMAQQIREGRGPVVSWPQGPANKYFPGYAFWWALFLSNAEDAEDSLRAFPVLQLAALAALIGALIAMGRMAWRSWPVALAFAALASSSSLVLKWASVPLSEVLAAATVAAILAAGLALEGNIASPVRRRAAIWALALFGALGAATRIEVALVLLVVVGALAPRRRIPLWSAGAVLAVAAAPILAWQVWLSATFGRPPFYIGEGAGAFDGAGTLNMFFFQIFYFFHVSNVVGPNAAANAAVTAFSFLFLASLVVALRGYLGRASLFASWTLLAYWALHSLWYYQTERYNVIVIPLGFLFFFEGVGRLVDRKSGWLCARGRLVAPLLLLTLVPAFWVHARDNVEAMRGAFAAGALRVDREGVVSALRREAGRGARPVVVTNLPIDIAHRFPAEVWFDLPSLLDSFPFKEPGAFPRFAAEHNVTHLVLLEPAKDWLSRNGEEGFDFQPIFSDGAVWIARVLPAESGR